MREPLSYEAWLRGPIHGVDPRIGALLHSFEQAREDLEHWTKDLSDAEIWEHPLGLAPLGFELKHIAGSVDRLATYLTGGQLTNQQLVELRAEMQPGAGRNELLASLRDTLARVEAIARALDPATFAEPREVGRQRLPSTVAGLLTHIAEHTQRHVGQAIIIVQVLRALRA
jgi:uncharacterized damage-inducible protein DinB